MFVLNLLMIQSTHPLTFLVKNVSSGCATVWAKLIMLVKEAWQYDVTSQGLRGSTHYIKLPTDF